MDIKEKIVKESNKESYDMDDLLTVMEILRSENGCVWDREQTHQSIRKNFIEETYEVVEAIDKNDMTLMREELGDVLFQVVFHSQMAKENGFFTFEDVVNDVCKKMVTRHPHVFSTVQADTTDKVLDNWDKIKMQSKDQKTPAEALESVSSSLPSLMRATKLAGKMQKYDVDISTLEERVGEILLGVSVLCDRCGIDAEKALYDSCNKLVCEVANQEKKED